MTVKEALLAATTVDEIMVALKSEDVILRKAMENIIKHEGFDSMRTAMAEIIECLPNDVHDANLAFAISNAVRIEVAQRSWEMVQEETPKMVKEVFSGGPVAFLRKFILNTPAAVITQMAEISGYLKWARSVVLRGRIFVLTDGVMTSYDRFFDRLMRTAPMVLDTLVDEPICLPFDRVVICGKSKALGVGESGGMHVAVLVERAGASILCSGLRLDPILNKTMSGCGLAVSRLRLDWVGTGYTVARMNMGDNDYGPPKVPASISEEASVIRLMFWLFNNQIPKFKGANVSEVRLEPSKVMAGTVHNKAGGKAHFINNTLLVMRRMGKRGEAMEGTPLEFPRDYRYRWEVRGHWRACRHIGKDPTGSYGVEGKTWVVPHICGPAGKPILKKLRVIADAVGESDLKREGDQ